MAEKALPISQCTEIGAANHAPLVISMILSFIISLPMTAISADVSIVMSILSRLLSTYVPL